MYAYTHKYNQTIGSIHLGERFHFMFECEFLPVQEHHRGTIIDKIRHRRPEWGRGYSVKGTREVIKISSV